MTLCVKFSHHACSSISSPHYRLIASWFPETSLHIPEDEASSPSRVQFSAPHLEDQMFITLVFIGFDQPCLMTASPPRLKVLPSELWGASSNAGWMKNENKNKGMSLVMSHYLTIHGHRWIGKPEMQFFNNGLWRVSLKSERLQFYLAFLEWNWNSQGVSYLVYLMCETTEWRFNKKMHKMDESSTGPIMSDKVFLSITILCLKL